MAMPLRPGDEESGALRAERAWAFDALASLADGVLVADARARLVYHNTAAQRMLGVDSLGPDPSTWARDFGIFRSDEVTPFPDAELPLVLALGGQTVRDIELFVRNHHVPAGRHILCSASPLEDTSRAIQGAVVIFHDNNEHKEREVRLVEAERQKQAILDNIPDIAWLKDAEGRFVLVNRRLAEVAGRRPDEMIGKTDFEFWPHDLAERYRADDEEVMRSGLHKRIEEPFVSAQGEAYWIETVKTRIVGDRGEVIGTTGLARDITERKRAEEALRQANDMLELRVQERTAELAAAQETLVRKERLAVLGQLAGGVAHQIRNPLAAIMNATYVLKRHMAPEQHPNVEDAIRIIHDEVRHANVIITGLLDFARVRTPDRQPASIVELLERVLAAEVVPEGIRVERIVEDVPLLDIDPNQIHGSLFNLLRNAIEAMPSGGVLRVEVREDGADVLIAVSDTGTGITPQVRGHLFEPLHSTKPAGIGLGLVTARTFVEAHGGRIRSVPMPTGARFEIRLPKP